MDLTVCAVTVEGCTVLYSKCDEQLFATKIRLFVRPNRTTYVQCTKGFIHRLVMGLTSQDGKQVDHIDGNGLNNTRQNLRICNNQSNSANRPGYTGSTSKYKGVSFRTSANRWQSTIKTNGKIKWLGTFKTQEEAAMAYDSASIELFGEFAYQNFPKSDNPTHCVNPVRSASLSI